MCVNFRMWILQQFCEKRKERREKKVSRFSRTVVHIVNGIAIFDFLVPFTHFNRIFSPERRRQALWKSTKSNTFLLQKKKMVKCVTKPKNWRKTEKIDSWEKKRKKKLGHFLSVSSTEYSPVSVKSTKVNYHRSLSREVKKKKIKEKKKRIEKKVQGTLSARTHTHTHRLSTHIHKPFLYSVEVRQV